MKTVKVSFFAFAAAREPHGRGKNRNLNKVAQPLCWHAISTMDHHGECVKGCRVEGRRYLHNGYEALCAFHYSDSNIHERALLEAYHSLLFMAYYEGQPFNAERLRSCPPLDNPAAPAGMADKSGECPRPFGAKCECAA